MHYNYDFKERKSLRKEFSIDVVVGKHPVLIWDATDSDAVGMLEISQTPMAAFSPSKLVKH